MNRGHRVQRTPSGSPRGASSPSPRQAVAAWLLLLGVIGGGAIAFGGGPGPVDASAPLAVVTQDATALYTANCATCHGVAGEGGVGPSLIGVGAAAADFYLRTGRMPLGAPDQRPVRQPPAFNEEQIQQLVAYVASLAPGPSIPTVQGGGDIGRGFELYTANCAACHGSTGAGNAVGGGFAAVSLHESAPLDVAEAVLIGPGVMPPFALSDADRAALIAYVEYLRTEPTPGGAAIGGVGPVAEGFIAILFGLVGVVVIARLVGSSGSEDGEGGEVAVGAAQADSAADR
jgi:ubiquinol-cytochrome c reductase cytochrome c subunit